MSIHQPHQTQVKKKAPLKEPQRREKKMRHIGTKRLRKIKNSVFALIFILAFLGLVHSARSSDWRQQDILSFVAILISLASLFNSIRLPRTVELTIVPEDITRDEAYVDLGDGSVQKSIIAYNTGEIRARGVVVRVEPVRAPPLTAEQGEMIRSASWELLRSFEQLGEEQPLAKYYLQSNIASPDNYWWLTGLATKSERYAEFTEKIMKMISRKELPPIEFYVGDVSSEQETKIVAIPYDAVDRWTSAGELVTKDICSTKVRLSYAYIDETRNGLVRGQYPKDFEIRWKTKLHRETSQDN